MKIIFWIPKEDFTRFGAYFKADIPFVSLPRWVKLVAVNHKFFSLGENAVTIDFGNEISTRLNDTVLDLAGIIQANGFDGFIEAVPAYSSLTVFFDLVKVRKAHREFPTGFSFVATFLKDSLKHLTDKPSRTERIVTIPVCYDPAFALDMADVAKYANTNRDEVVRLHTSVQYRVFMIGFLPGFAYMGEVDERIAAPRKTTPRVSVERGSVGIAGKQTGIYPLESPGGWQIIGKTPIPMFRPGDSNLSLLLAGDSVSFYEISIEEFWKLTKPVSNGQ